MSYQCETKQQPLQPVLAIRTRTAVQGLPQVLGQAYGRIMQYMGELGEAQAGEPYVAYYNMDMADLDIEVGIPVARTLTGKDEVLAKEIPAGLVATCVYTGPYHEISPAYEALGQWMEANGFHPSGVAYEYYLNDPMDTPPQELQTRIVFPLQ